MFRDTADNELKNLRPHPKFRQPRRRSEALPKDATLNAGAQDGLYSPGAEVNAKPGNPRRTTTIASILNDLKANTKVEDQGSGAC